jgi:aconitate hydratase
LNSTQHHAQTRRFEAGTRHFCHIDVRSILGTDVYDRMPFVARVLAENLLRNATPREVVMRTLAQRTAPSGTVELPLHMARVILPDSSGIPVLMDLAALRSALSRRGVSFEKVRSQVPITLVVDHSLQVDIAGRPGAVAENLAFEYGHRANVPCRGRGRRRPPRS